MADKVKDFQMTGEQFKSLRGAWGLTQAEMADVLGVDKLTVSAWEREKNRRPVPPTVALLLASLSVVMGRVLQVHASKAK